MAFAFAAETAEQVADAALHFHGGYGFMLEYDIQLYFRRVKAWALLDGDGQAELGRLADALWGTKEN
jgi:alkylation response protein AidB-like acyl-CoA dehydrogenase